MSHLPSILRNTLVISVLCSAQIGNAEAPAPSKSEKTDEPATTAPVDPDNPQLHPGEDYLCQAEIFYTWKPTPPSTGEGDVETRAARSTTTADASATTSEYRREFALVIGESGLVRAEVKNRLEGRIPGAQLEAVEQCKAEHEDRTSCVATKVRRGVDSYRRLDFIGRQAMREAMNRDCESNLGTCGTSEVSEINCIIDRSPEASPPKAEETEASTEPAKGAKKK